MSQDIDTDDLALIQNFLKDRVDSAMLDKIVPEATLSDLGIDSPMNAISATTKLNSIDAQNARHAPSA